MSKSAAELSAIANKAVATRKKNKSAAELSAIANKAVATRRQNEANEAARQESEKRRNAALKAWATRRGK